MRKILSCVATVLFFVTAAAQSSVTLTFACRTTVGHYVQPDSITVENLSQGWTETLLYPDTIYLLNVGTGIPNVETQSVASLQVSPNPFKGIASVNLDMTEPGEMTMEIADVRGLLYNWPAAMHGNSSSNTSPSGVQGICPTGWHVPSDLEWTQLLTYLGNQFPYLCDYDSTYIAKSLAATSGWNNYNVSCTVGYSQATNNATGFSAYPAGYSISNYYSYLGQNAFFWSPTEIDNFGALARYLNYGQEYVTRKNFSKFLGYSVRCLRD